MTMARPASMLDVAQPTCAFARCGGAWILPLGTLGSMRRPLRSSPSHAHDGDVPMRCGAAAHVCHLILISQPGVAWNSEKCNGKS